MAKTITSINVTVSGYNNYTSSAPSQRAFAMNTQWPGYVRNMKMLDDVVIATYYTTSVQIPLYGSGSLWYAMISASGVLTPPPSIGLQPTNSVIAQPSPAYFAISASTETGTINYQWYYNSGSNNNTWYPIVSTGSYTGSATPALTSSTTNINYQNIANYRCVVSNTNGTPISSSIATLNVLLNIPTILTQPANSSVTHPAPAYFALNAVSSASMNYQWYYQSGSGNWSSIVSTASYTGSATTALTSSATYTSYQNTASYFCYVSNQAGGVSSSVAILNVI